MVSDSRPARGGLSPSSSPFVGEKNFLRPVGKDWRCNINEESLYIIFLWHLEIGLCLLLEFRVMVDGAYLGAEVIWRLRFGLPHPQSSSISSSTTPLPRGNNGLQASPIGIGIFLPGSISSSIIVPSTDVLSIEFRSAFYSTFFTGTPLTSTSKGFSWTSLITDFGQFVPSR